MLLATKPLFVLFMVTSASVVLAENAIGQCVDACLQLGLEVSPCPEFQCFCGSQDAIFLYGQCLENQCGAFGVGVGNSILDSDCGFCTLSHPNTVVSPLPITNIHSLTLHLAKK
ncbi:hypothetical protein BD410DRAFT_167927 [Rickenella mellea]|uniref:Extracellular membrane protein CFEM domain-containing protein n=1 Tax=Rickenella mellea TaxID=50990 RepID=A0A4Y7PIF2_9AGAM|nr:hypothetical protein BD410DRAFT_167927 [Rickenella mellea]